MSFFCISASAPAGTVGWDYLFIMKLSSIITRRAGNPVRLRPPLQAGQPLVPLHRRQVSNPRRQTKNVLHPGKKPYFTQ